MVRHPMACCSDDLIVRCPSGYAWVREHQVQDANGGLAWVVHQCRGYRTTCGEL